MTKQELLDFDHAISDAKAALYRCEIYGVPNTFGNNLIPKFNHIIRELSSMQSEVNQEIERMNSEEESNPAEPFHNAYDIMSYLKTRDRSLMLRVHDLMQTKVPASTIKQLFNEYYGSDDEYREMTCKVSTYVTLIPVGNQ